MRTDCAVPEVSVVSHGTIILFAICFATIALLLGSAAPSAAQDKPVDIPPDAKHASDVSTPVHQWIAKEAAALYDNQFEGTELPSYLGTIEHSGDDGRVFGTNDGDDILEGTYEEDTPLIWMNHFVAGGDGDELYTGLWGWDSAYERAQQLWGTKITSTAFNSDRALTYYWLGRIAHLIADMTTPTHTHNDTHVLPLDRDAYEHTLAENDNYFL